jgi:hypothetical protein
MTAPDNRSVILSGINAGQTIFREAPAATVALPKHRMLLPGNQLATILEGIMKMNPAAPDYFEIAALHSRDTDPVPTIVSASERAIDVSKMSPEQSQSYTVGSEK